VPHALLRSGRLVGKAPVPGPGLPSPAQPPRPTSHGAIQYFYNWTGYAAVAHKNVALRYVSASFYVPSLDCANSPAGSAGPASAAQWVGLDGDTSATVEQIGINGYCDNGTPAYYAWYQLYPAGLVTLTTAINAGDAISASVYYDASTREYELTLNDVTSGQSSLTVASCPAKATCENSSAEAITSDPNGGTPDGWNLADYGSESFIGGTVTSRDGVKGSFAASSLWDSDEIVMLDTAKAVMAYPSPLQGGAAFSTTWLTAS
jgi:hypothetical protein